MPDPKPTVGRIVHYFPAASNQPQAAIVTAAHTDTCVSLTTFPWGQPSVPRTSVNHTLQAPPGAERWEWPPRS
jgi:hypothetical protein